LAVALCLVVKPWEFKGKYMKNIFKSKNVVRIGLSSILWLSSLAHAVVDIQHVPSIKLQDVIPGSTMQAVEDIPDKTKLSIFYNDLLMNQIMNLPGWNSSTNNKPDEKQILNAFAVRTTQDPTQLKAQDSLFYAGQGVGRSGIWEKQSAGDAFAYIDGRPLKGLTIKGYGGNAGRGYQPNGSLAVAEAYRDTMLSKILMEKGADTYIGALTVIRPVNSSARATESQANYIRLSRSSLRMNDLIDRKGGELKATVAHLSQLVSDELGRVPTPEEFTDWLVLRSARTLAHKEHARVTASNHNKDNFGIAELVDFGEAAYTPFSFNHGLDVYGKPGNAWMRGLKPAVIEAAQNIALEYGFKKDYSALFDQTYRDYESSLIKHDALRLSLEKATAQQMKDIGLSDLTISRIEKLREELPFGILSTEDVLQKVAMINSEKKIILAQTKTQTMTLPDGHIMPNVMLDAVGGPQGLRDILTKTISEISAGQFNTKQALSELLKVKVKEKMTELGNTGYLNGISYGPRIEENLAILMATQISSDLPHWQTLYSAAVKKTRTGVACKAIF
jgi:hypothetical protein